MNATGRPLSFTSATPAAAAAAAAAAENKEQQEEQQEEDNDEEEEDEDRITPSLLHQWARSGYVCTHCAAPADRIFTEYSQQCIEAAVCVSE